MKWRTCYLFQRAHTVVSNHANEVSQEDNVTANVTKQQEAASVKIVKEPQPPCSDDRYCPFCWQYLSTGRKRNLKFSLLYWNVGQKNMTWCDYPVTVEGSFAQPVGTSSEEEEERQQCCRKNVNIQHGGPHCAGAPACRGRDYLLMAFKTTNAAPKEAACSSLTRKATSRRGI